MAIAIPTGTVLVWGMAEVSITGGSSGHEPAGIDKTGRPVSIGYLEISFSSWTGLRAVCQGGMKGEPIHLSLRLPNGVLFAYDLKLKRVPEDEEAVPIARFTFAESPKRSLPH